MSRLVFLGVRSWPCELLLFFLIFFVFLLLPFVFLPHGSWSFGAEKHRRRLVYLLNMRIQDRVWRGIACLKVESVLLPMLAWSNHRRWALSWQHLLCGAVPINEFSLVQSHTTHSWRRAKISSSPRKSRTMILCGCLSLSLVLMLLLSVWSWYDLLSLRTDYVTLM